MVHDKIKIDAVVTGDIHKIWDLWTNPEHVVNWNFASDEWYCPRAISDFEIGGKLNYRMEAKDGSFGFDFEAIFDDIQQLKKVSYNMLDGRNATTLFEDLGNGTASITTHFDPEGVNPIEMQKFGWQAILNNFKKYAESHQ